MVGVRRGRARRRQPAHARRRGHRSRAPAAVRRRVPRRQDRRRPPRAAPQADQRTRASGGDPEMSDLERIDPELFAAIEGERRRQVEKIALIPSENYTSQAVLEASGSVLTNKYA